MGNLKDLKNTISAETREQFIFFEIIRNHAVYDHKSKVQKFEKID